MKTIFDNLNSQVSTEALNELISEVWVGKQCDLNWLLENFTNMLR